MTTSNGIRSKSRAASFWGCVRRFLESRMWVGIGVLIAVPALISQLHVLMGQGVDLVEASNLEESRPQTDVKMPEIAVAQASPRSVEFSKSKRVRCPGGGDWLWRERNKRSTFVEFTAPKGTWIIADAHIRTDQDNYGDYGKIVYSVSNIDGMERKTGAKVELWCDPPNQPGAPGGWMKISLYGQRTAPSVSAVVQ